MSEYMENQGRNRRRSNRDAWTAACAMLVLAGMAIVAFAIALYWGHF